MKIKKYGLKKNDVVSYLELSYIDNTVKNTYVYNNYLGHGTMDSLIGKTLEDAHEELIKRGFYGNND